MGFFDLLFSIIALTAVGSAAVVYFAGRAAWRGGKRLLGWARDQKLLEGERKGATQEAQDVVVERMDGRQGKTPPNPQGTTVQEPPRAQAKPTSEQAAYVRLDVEAGTTPKQICEVMRPYESDPVLGERASGVIQTLSSLRRREHMFAAEVEGAFQRGSLSYDKFALPAQAAFESIRRNAALMGNRIQAFDTAGYLRLFKSVQRDALGEEHAGASTRAERLRIYQEMLASIDTIQETNDGLLFELDKLITELGNVSQAGGTAESDSILSEIHRLVEEAKYYR